MRQADAYYDGGCGPEMAGSGTRRYESGDVYEGDLAGAAAMARLNPTLTLTS